MHFIILEENALLSIVIL